WPQVAIGEDRRHAFARARLGDVNAGEVRMRHRTANEAGMQKAGQRDIVDETSDTTQEIAVLEARNCAAHPRGVSVHSELDPSSSGARASHDGSLHLAPPCAGLEG